MTSSTPTSLSAPASLRERKKAKTRIAIRDAAMRLFEEQGYAATTVDQIVEAADVSQSTFFRYFPAKEDVVLNDDFDPLVVAGMRAQPPGTPPVETIRLGIRAAFAEITAADWDRERQRQRLVRTEPDLRARAMQQYIATIGLLADVIAERAGLQPGDFSARVLSGAVIGAVLATAPDGMTTDIEYGHFERLDAALNLLQSGLPLGPVPGI